MSQTTTYGLHPTIWRALRRKSPGDDLVMRNSKGEALFTGFLFRYCNQVSVPTGRFKEISWKQTLLQTPKTDENALIGPTNIPIGDYSWG